MIIPDVWFKHTSAVQSEQDATVHPQVAMENSRALWRTLAGVPRRPEPDIATPAAVRNESSTSSLLAAKKRSKSPVRRSSSIRAWCGYQAVVARGPRVPWPR